MIIKISEIYSQPVYRIGFHITFGDEDVTIYNDIGEDLYVDDINRFKSLIHSFDFENGDFFTFFKETLPNSLDIKGKITIEFKRSHIGNWFLIFDYTKGEFEDFIQYGGEKLYTDFYSFTLSLKECCNLSDADLWVYFENLYTKRGTDFIEIINIDKSNKPDWYRVEFSNIRCYMHSKVLLNFLLRNMMKDIISGNTVSITKDYSNTATKAAVAKEQLLNDDFELDFPDGDILAFDEVVEDNNNYIVKLIKVTF